MKNLIYISLCLILFSCNNKKPNENFLGVINIVVTGSDDAQPYFEKGLLLLHSFEYEDAREEFQMAQQKDPNMAIAYWGEAMTYNHGLWSQQNFEEAIATLNKLQTIENINSITELEKDFIEAVKILYGADKTKNERDIDYSNYMKQLSVKYPDNHEITAFYALSLLGSVADGRDENIYGKGAIVAQGILEENPNHPGALHYLIHSYDDPDHAKLALKAANSYSKVAPDASHALHMPSHIYVAMGMWDEVVSSNERSYQASINRMQRKNLDNDARGYHAYHWLEYGYLQQGRKEDAKKLVDDLLIYNKEKPSKRSRTYVVYLKGTYLAETNQWDGEIANISLNVNDLNLSTRSQYDFLEGMKAFKMNDSIALSKSIESIQKDYDKESYLVTYDNAAFCSSAGRSQTSPSMLVGTKIRLNQLLALQSWLKNDDQMTEKYLIKSIELDESLSYSYGPPVIKKPTHELYADWLISQNRLKDADKQYELTLVRAPNRRLALEGKNMSQQI
jgi:tetratricopeptide (TPR) repeat protein